MAVPTVEHERLRDLVRCREDIRADLMRARHRLGKFLLRREIYYEGPNVPWSRRHREWLASLTFADRASRLTIADYLHAHDLLIARRDRIEAELEEVAADSTVDGRDRATEVPARDRHPLSARPVCRDRRWDASSTPTACRHTSGSCLARTPPASDAAKARSPRPGPPTLAGC